MAVRSKLLTFFYFYFFFYLLECIEAVEQRLIVIEEIRTRASMIGHRD